MQKEVVTHLPRMWACCTVDEGVERQSGPAEGFRTHRSADLGKKTHVNGVIKDERSYRCREGGAIQNSQVLLGCKGDGCDAVGLKRLP